MKTKTFKNKFVSIIAAAAMLAGTLPVFAARSNAVSFATKVGYANEVAGGYDEMYGFTAAGSEFLVMQMTKAQIEASEKPYVEYELYAEQSGEYIFEIESSPLENPPYTSPATVSVNGTSVDSFTQIASTNDNWKTYSGKVNLTAGANKLRFTITGASGNAENKEDTAADYGLFHLHNIKFKRIGASTIVEGNTLIIEAQDYDVGTHTLSELTHSSAYGGSYFYPGGVKTSQVSYTYTVFAEEAGKYDMSVFAGDYQNWLGRFEVLVNGTVVGDMRNDTGVFCTYKKAVAAVNSTWYIREHYPIEVDLNKGANTVIIRSYEGGPSNNNWSFALDCIKFAKKGGAGGSLKFDDNAGSSAGSSYYGGYAHQMFNGISETFNLDVPAGTYELYVHASCSVFTNYLGTLSLKVGGEDFVDFNSDTTSDTEYLFGDIGGEFKYINDLTLTGDETLEFKTTAPAISGSNTYTLLDCFELVPKNESLSKAEMKMNDTELKCGETMQTTSKLYYNNGYEASDRFVKSVSYSSSDEKVLEVDSDGVITAVNPGTATVTVTYNDAYSASEEITVYDESGIFPVAFEYDSATKTATVKVTATADTSSSVTVIFGAVSKANGLDTSFANVPAVTVTPVRGRVTTAKAQVEGDNIRAFIWNSLSGMRPVADSTNLK